jgi:hypothetical protein
MMLSKVRFAVAFVAAACPPWRAFRPASLNSPPVPAILILYLLLCFASGVKTASAQDTQPQSQPQSLGDVARQARAAKASAPKSATVLDDDNLPKSKGGPAGGGGGKLSPDKQAFCDELRQRKDPAAEQGCAVLAIDMGPEYENMTARYADLSKSVCAANGGRLPTSDPKNPSLSAQYRELTEVGAKFGAMMQEEMKTFRDSEAAVNAVRQEEYTELAANVPDWRNAEALSANPEEKQRFLEIAEKYKAREQETEAASGQARARGLRYLYDTARLQEVCGHH